MVKSGRGNRVFRAPEYVEMSGLPGAAVRPGAGKVPFCSSDPPRCCAGAIWCVLGLPRGHSPADLRAPLVSAEAMLGRGVVMMPGRSWGHVCTLYGLPAACRVVRDMRLPVATEGIMPGGGVMPADGWMGVWALI